MDEAGGGGGLVIGRIDGIDQRAADDNPVGQAADRRRLLRRADAEADGQRRLRPGADAADEAGQVGVELSPRPGDAGDADEVDEAAGAGR